jgi:hypothetical protein
VSQFENDTPSVPAHSPRTLTQTNAAPGIHAPPPACRRHANADTGMGGDSAPPTAAIRPQKFLRRFNPAFRRPSHVLRPPSACPQHAFRMPSARLPPSSARLQPARRQTPGMPPNAGAHRKPTGVCQSLHDYAICRNNMRAAVILWPAMIEREPINGMALACLN